MGNPRSTAVVVALGLVLGPSTPCRGAAFRLAERNVGPPGTEALPLWYPEVALARAADPVAALPESTRWAIDRFLAAGGRADSGECVGFGDVVSEGELFARKYATSLDLLIEAAPNILVGRVSRLEAGLYLGSPASIAEIQVAEWIRRPIAPEATPPASIYVVLPRAELHVGGFRLCASDSRWTRFPAVGARVALLSLFPPIADPHLFELGTLPLELVQEDPSGRALLPSGLERSGAVAAGLGFDVLIDQVRSLASTSGSRPVP
jgi:hypothetical protein